MMTICRHTFYRLVLDKCVPKILIVFGEMSAQDFNNARLVHIIFPNRVGQSCRIFKLHV